MSDKDVLYGQFSIELNFENFDLQQENFSRAFDANDASEMTERSVNTKGVLQASCILLVSSTCCSVLQCVAVCCSVLQLYIAYASCLAHICEVCYIHIIGNSVLHTHRTEGVQKEVVNYIHIVCCTYL